MLIEGQDVDGRRRIDREVGFTSNRAVELAESLPEGWQDLAEIDAPYWWPTEGEFDEVEWSTGPPG